MGTKKDEKNEREIKKGGDGTREKARERQRKREAERKDIQKSRLYLPREYNKWMIIEILMENSYFIVRFQYITNKQVNIINMIGCWLLEST